MFPAWLLWTIAALLSWGVWAILSKLIGESLSASHNQALSTIGLLPVALALLFSRRLVTTGNRMRGALFAIGAGGLACGGNVAYYRALNLGEKAATVVALTGLYPLVTVLLAILLLRERLNKVQLTGIFFSLAAIYLFNVTGEAGLFSSALLWALVPIAFWGLAGLLQKLASNHISGELSTLWFLAAFVPTAGFILWREPLSKELSLKTWLLVAALGFTFALGNYALLTALAKNGKASIVVPLSGLYPLVSIPIAIIALHERIGIRETSGMALALVAVVALAFESPPAKNENRTPDDRPVSRTT